MARFTRTILIDADPSDIWPVLADIGAIDRWNPGVEASRRTSELESGLGAERHCDLGSGNGVQERVAEWVPERALTMEIVKTDLPFRRARVRFTLEPKGSGTEVSVTPDYALKYGLLGKLMDRFMVTGQYTRGMDALLEGLKGHVEGRAARHPA